ncbi:MAG: hypothetical protein WEE03_06175, partial [Chloroflexota bacterium]
RHDRVYREGKDKWTERHLAWAASHRSPVDRPLHISSAERPKCGADQRSSREHVDPDEGLVAML